MNKYFKEGLEAFKNNKTLGDNPYQYNFNDNTNPWHEWQRGYYSGKANINMEQNKCFEEGKSARLNNLDFIVSNPYKYGTENYYKWIDGWVIQDRCINAKEQGKIAANSSVEFQDNPYPKNFPQHDSWADGYKEAETAFFAGQNNISAIESMNEQIKKAFLDVVDGMSVHDIRANTGLPENRCQEIYNLYQKLMKNN